MYYAYTHPSKPETSTLTYRTESRNEAQLLVGSSVMIVVASQADHNLGTSEGKHENDGLLRTEL